MHSSGEFSVKTRCRIARGPAQVQRGVGIGTATLEANLAQYIAGIAHKPLFQVFLYILKTCDSLNRERCLEVLSWYGVGINLTRLLKFYWERQRIAPKTGKFLGNYFRTGRGLTQGDPASQFIYDL